MILPQSSKMSTSMGTSRIRFKRSLPVKSQGGGLSASIDVGEIDLDVIFRIRRSCFNILVPPAQNANSALSSNQKGHTTISLERKDAENGQGMSYLHPGFLSSRKNHETSKEQSSSCDLHEIYGPSFCMERRVRPPSPNYGNTDTQGVIIQNPPQELGAAQKSHDIRREEHCADGAAKNHSVKLHSFPQTDHRNTHEVAAIDKGHHLPASQCDQIVRDEVNNTRKVCFHHERDSEYEDEDSLDLCIDDFTLSTHESVSSYGGRGASHHYLHGEDESILFSMVDSPLPSLKYPSLVLANTQRFNALAHVKFIRLSIERVTLVNPLHPGILYSIRYNFPPRAIVTNDMDSTKVEVPLYEAEETLSRTVREKAQTTSTLGGQHGKGKPNISLPEENQKVIEVAHSQLMGVSFDDDKLVQQWLESFMSFELVINQRRVSSISSSKHKHDRVKRKRGFSEGTLADSSGTVATAFLPLRDVLATNSLSILASLDLIYLPASRTTPQLVLGTISVDFALVGEKSGNGGVTSNVIVKDPSFESIHSLTSRRSVTRKLEKTAGVEVARARDSKNENVHTFRSQSEGSRMTHNNLHTVAEPLSFQRAVFNKNEGSNIPCKSRLTPVLPPPLWLWVEVSSLYFHIIGCSSKYKKKCDQIRIRISCATAIASLDQLKRNRINRKESYSSREVAFQEVVTRPDDEQAELISKKNVDLVWQAALEPSQTKYSTISQIAVMLEVWSTMKLDNTNQGNSERPSSKEILVGIAKISLPTDALMSNSGSYPRTVMPFVVKSYPHEIRNPYNGEVVGSIKATVAIGLLRQVRQFPATNLMALKIQRFWRLRQKNIIRKERSNHFIGEKASRNFIEAPLDNASSQLQISGKKGRENLEDPNFSSYTILSGDTICDVNDKNYSSGSKNVHSMPNLSSSSTTTQEKIILSPLFKIPSGQNSDISDSPVVIVLEHELAVVKIQRWWSDRNHFTVERNKPLQSLSPIANKLPIMPDTGYQKADECNSCLPVKYSGDLCFLQNFCIPEEHGCLPTEVRLEPDFALTHELSEESAGLDLTDNNIDMNRLVDRKSQEGEESPINCQTEPSSDNDLRFIVEVGITAGLREVISLWYEQNVVPKSHFKSKSSPFLASGVILSFCFLCYPHGEDYLLEPNAPCTYFSSRILSLGSIYEDNSFELEVPFVTRESDFTINHIQTESIVFNLWFVPTVTTQLLSQFPSTATGSPDLPNNSSKVCVAHCQLHKLLETKEYCDKIPWRMSIDDDGQENVSIGFVEVKIYWADTTLRNHLFFSRIANNNIESMENKEVHFQEFFSNSSHDSDSRPYKDDNNYIKKEDALSITVDHIINESDQQKDPRKPNNENVATLMNASTSVFKLNSEIEPSEQVMKSLEYKSGFIAISPIVKSIKQEAPKDLLLSLKASFGTHEAELKTMENAPPEVINWLFNNKLLSKNELYKRQHNGTSSLNGGESSSVQFHNPESPSSSLSKSSTFSEYTSDDDNNDNMIINRNLSSVMASLEGINVKLLSKLDSISPQNVSLLCEQDEFSSALEIEQNSQKNTVCLEASEGTEDHEEELNPEKKKLLNCVRDIPNPNRTPRLAEQMNYQHTSLSKRSPHNHASSLEFLSQAIGNKTQSCEKNDNNNIPGAEVDGDIAREDTSKVVTHSEPQTNLLINQLNCTQNGNTKNDQVINKDAMVDQPAMSDCKVIIFSEDSDRGNKHANRENSKIVSIVQPEEHFFLQIENHSAATKKAQAETNTDDEKQVATPVSSSPPQIANNHFSNYSNRSFINEKCTIENEKALRPLDNLMQTKLSNRWIHTATWESNDSELSKLPSLHDQTLLSDSDSDTRRKPNLPNTFMAEETDRIANIMGAYLRAEECNSDESDWSSERSH